VERTSSGVGVHPLLDELSVLNFVSCYYKRKRKNNETAESSKKSGASKDINEQLNRKRHEHAKSSILTGAGHNHGLSTNNNNLLSEKKLLSHDRGKSAQQVALAINNNSISHD
jgi:hypothetical protein